VKTSTSSHLSGRRRPLAACCAALFGLAAPEAYASSSWLVTSCNDDGAPGTLRYVIANQAQSGDTVDMTGLNCSSISLATGAIGIPQASLTVQGPGVTHFPIVGNAVADTIFYHTGTGTLFVNDLNLEHGNGHKLGNGLYLGGCIFSSGNVMLTRSRLTGCQVYNPSSTYAGAADGGCIATLGNLFLSHSTITGCIVDAAPANTGALYGGGAFVGGNLTVKYSEISNNLAGFANYGIYSKGGGVIARGNAAIYESTISNNASRYQSGGIHIESTVSGATATITNSTISGNQAPKVGGLYSNEPTTISNSTIAFNIKRSQSGLSAGAVFSAKQWPVNVTLHSTLIANNQFVRPFPTPPVDNDLGVANVGTYAVTFATDAQQGNFNLVLALDSSVSSASLPPDTIIGKCPLLAPLRDNGGETKTHALYSGSPAIDAGVNNLGLAYDQRGGPQPVPNPIPPPPLAYDRHSGVRTDIGAYEVQRTDVVFDSGFEGCP